MKWHINSGLRRLIPIHSHVFKDCVRHCNLKVIVVALLNSCAAHYNLMQPCKLTWMIMLLPNKRIHHLWSVHNGGCGWQTWYFITNRIKQKIKDYRMRMNLRKTLVLPTDTQPRMSLHLIGSFSRKNYGTWIPLLKVKTIFTWCMSECITDMRIFIYKIRLFPSSGSFFMESIKFEGFCSATFYLYKTFGDLLVAFISQI